MKISVTQKHIKHGVPNRCNTCPIALALHEAGIYGPSVKASYFIRESGNDGFVDRVHLPKSARRFIARFDEGEPVEPFEFEIDLEAV